MKADFTQLERTILALTAAAELLIPVAIEAERGQILRRTAQGRDADGKTFPKWRDFYPAPRKVQPWAYSPSQSKKRAEAGLPTDIKTISFTGGTLATLGKHDNTLTVDDEHMPIMVGQMQHPRWKYHHNVLGVNAREDIPVMKREIVTMLNAHL